MATQIDLICDLLSGQIDDIKPRVTFDVPSTTEYATQIAEYNASNDRAEKYVSFFDIILYNDITYIQKLANIYKTNTIVQYFITMLLDTCEKWKLINYYNIMPRLRIVDDPISQIYIYKYINTCIIFDCERLNEIIKRLKKRSYTQ